MVCVYCTPQKGGDVNSLSASSSVNSSISDQVNIKHVQVSGKGVRLKPSMLESFNFSKGSQASCLFLPGLVVLTNHPDKLTIFRAIEELQYRQDETKQDFAVPIMQLADVARRM